LTDKKDNNENQEKIKNKIYLKSMYFEKKRDIKKKKKELKKFKKNLFI
jgi:hypothetical protein